MFVFVVVDVSSTTFILWWIVKMSIFKQKKKWKRNKRRKLEYDSSKILNDDR